MRPVTTNPAIVHISGVVLVKTVHSLKALGAYQFWRGIYGLWLEDSQKTIGVNLGEATDVLEVSLLDMETKDGVVARQCVLKPYKSVIAIKAIMADVKVLQGFVVLENATEFVNGFWDRVNLLELRLRGQVF